jgi:hypothetical protein
VLQALQEKILVNQLLNDKAFEEVDIFVRKPVDIENDKLKVHVVILKNLKNGKNGEGRCCIFMPGNYFKGCRKQGSPEKVDFDYQYEFAKAAKENDVEDYILVSAYGANPKSKIFYSKMKGELEEAVKQLHFNKITIFKPGMLERKNSERTGEVLGSRIIKFANKLDCWKVRSLYQLIF